MKTQKTIKLPLLLKQYAEEKDFLVSSRVAAVKRKIPVIDDTTGSFLATVSLICTAKEYP